MVLLYRRRLLSSLAKYRSNKLGRNHVTKSRCSLFIYPAHTLLQSISTQRLSASSCSAGSKRVTDWSLRKRTTTPHVMSAAAPPLSRHRHTHIHTHQLSSCPQVDNWGFNFMLGWPSPPPPPPWLSIAVTHWGSRGVCMCVSQLGWDYLFVSLCFCLHASVYKCMFVLACTLITVCAFMDMYFFLKARVCLRLRLVVCWHVCVCSCVYLSLLKGCAQITCWKVCVWERGENSFVSNQVSSTN